MIIDSEIYKFFRTLNDFIPPGELLLDTFGSTDVFISIIKDTYFIFDLHKFDILFTGPYIVNISQYYFHNGILFISTGKRLQMYKRSSCIGQVDYENEISQIICVGDVLMTLHCDGNIKMVDYNNVLVDGKITLSFNTMNSLSFNTMNSLSCNTMNSLSCNTMNVHLVHHPHTYLNKILLISDSQSILYNFIKKKEVYKFKSLKKGVCIIRDTKAVDLVGVGYKDGRIDIVNLKKDEIVITFNISNKRDNDVETHKGISGELINKSNDNDGEFNNEDNHRETCDNNSDHTLLYTDLDFSENKMCVVSKGSLYLFDLIEKRHILTTQALSGKFIGDNHLLITKSSSILLTEINKDKLEIIKMKNNLREVLGIEEGSIENNFAVIGKDEVFRYNTGNTLTYDKLKFTGEIEKYDLSNGEGVLYGGKILYKLGTSIKYILNAEVSLLSSYKDICVILNGDLIILNMSTKTVYKRIPVEGDVKCLKIDRTKLYVLYDERGNVNVKECENNLIDNDGNTKLSIIDYKTNSTHLSYQVGSFDSFKVFDYFIVLSSKTNLAFFTNGRIFRTFDFSKSDNTKTTQSPTNLHTQSPTNLHTQSPTNLHTQSPTNLHTHTDFAVSPNLKWLAVCYGPSILLFDILTGHQIDSIPVEGKFVRFTTDMLFLIVVTKDSRIVLLNNKSSFSPLRPKEGKQSQNLNTKIAKEDFLKVKKKHQKLTGEILLLKTLQNESSFTFNVDELLDHLTVDNLEEFTLILNKILRTKTLPKKDLERLEKRYEEIFSKYEEDYMKSVGYLEIEREMGR